MLVGVVVLLVLALIGTATVGLVKTSRLNSDVSTLRKQRDADRQRAEAAAEKQQNDFRSANLATKFDRVKSLDKAVDSAQEQWRNGSARFGVLNQAINDCDGAIDEYDRLAAPFPDSMFGSIPKKINLANPETDCGRASTSSI